MALNAEPIVADSCLILVGCASLMPNSDDTLTAVLLVLAPCELTENDAVIP